MEINIMSYSLYQLPSHLWDGQIGIIYIGFSQIIFMVLLKRYESKLFIPSHSDKSE